MQAVTAASGVLPEETLRGESAADEASIAAELERQLRLQEEALAAEAAADKRVQFKLCRCDRWVRQHKCTVSRSRRACF